jgi:hypothetical protein
MYIINLLILACGAAFIESIKCAVFVVAELPDRHMQVFLFRFHQCGNKLEYPHLTSLNATQSELVHFDLEHQTLADAPFVSGLSPRKQAPLRKRASHCALFQRILQMPFFFLNFKCQRFESVSIFLPMSLIDIPLPQGLTPIHTNTSAAA